MASVRIRWALYQFEASTVPHPPMLIVARHGRTAADKVYSRVFNAHDEREQAREWLGDMGLDARQARRLLDAAVRGTGPFADPRHPRRVASGPEAASPAAQQGPVAALLVPVSRSGGNGDRGRTGA